MKIDFSKLDMRDALDLAILVELEAEERYLEFSNLMGERYEGDAGSFFLQMSKNEVKHAQQLKQRRQNLFADAEVRVNGFSVWNVEAPDEGLPRPYMSIRDAFEIAMAAEQKAWDFFNDALAVVSDAGVIELFKELRNEEAEHKKMLQLQMQKYHIPCTHLPDRDDDEIDEPPAL